MKIATWNVERPRPRSPKNPYRIQHLLKTQADIIILTETHRAINLSPDYWGVQTQPSPRKPRDGEAVAAIWLRTSEVEVLGTVQTAEPSEAICVELLSKAGPLLVYGSIIPYHGYKGAAGQSALWVEHKRAIAWHREDWLRLRSQFPDHHLIAAGDYNQHRDGVGQYGSREVRELLSIALQDAGLSCVTEEDFVANGKLTRHTIDHVCMTSALVANLIHIDAWEGTLDGKRLSDHNGVLVSINTNHAVSRVSVDCANPRN